MIWDELLAALPLVAIVRGLRPDEAVGIGEALHDAGFRCMEVPLNSPDPLKSIERLAHALGDRMLVGAGTVLEPKAVQEIASAGGQLIVSPNADPAVIAATRRAGLVSMPAFFTATEAFAALAAGADALKLFPAEGASPRTLKALKAVLPPQVPVFPVGGVDAEAMGPWRLAGAAGFGIGSAVYRPGQTPAEVRAQATAFVTAWQGSAPV